MTASHANALRRPVIATLNLSVISARVDKLRKAAVGRHEKPHKTPAAIITCRSENRLHAVATSFASARDDRKDRPPYPVPTARGNLLGRCPEPQSTNARSRCPVISTECHWVLAAVLAVIRADRRGTTDGNTSPRTLHFDGATPTSFAKTCGIEWLDSSATWSYWSG